MIKPTTIAELQRDAYEQADGIYQQWYNMPCGELDKDAFIKWARLWLIMMITHDHINGLQSVFGPETTEESYHDQIMKAYVADFDACLEAMYG